MNEAFESLAISHAEGILTVELSNPSSRNAVSGVMHAELPRLFQAVARDQSARVIVLRGDPRGRAFSAGGDLQWLKEEARTSAGYERIFYDGLAIIRSMLDVPQPIISLIDGPAIGLGATIALFADVSFMASDAYIGDPHVAVGVVAGDGGAALWPLLIGPNRAKEYLMTGERIAASNAGEMGLVNHVVDRDELETAVYALAARLAQGARMAIQFTKLSVNAHLRAAVEAAVPASLALEGLTFQTPEALELLERARPRVSE